LIIKIATHFRFIIIQPSQVGTTSYLGFFHFPSFSFIFPSNLKLLIFRLRMIGLIEEG
jgi:hypothetical protein